jgi:crotonobetainyl-CoA:carnitine CoA-transferase CaiB-like acyl-CoA transferase
VNPDSAPLEGIRVLDLTRLLPGNYCTLVMAALGADVIKVEDHGAGDYIRRYGTQVEGTGVIDHQVNRGKRSICLDLKDPVQRGHFEALVATSSILVESFRPGTLDKLGYPVARLHELRPDLVIASISGFGADGPLASAHAHDLNFMALSGLLDRLGEIGGDPLPLPIPLADLLGGLVSALFTIPYLRRAEATGHGAVIDAPLFEALALMPSSLLSEIVAGTKTGMTVGGRGEFKLGAGLATYAVYAAKDGHVALVAQEAHFWAGLVEVVGLEDLSTRQADPDAQDAIRARLTAFFGARTKAEIEAAFAGRPACISLLQSYEEMLTSPHATARGYVRTDPDAPVPELVLPVTVDGARPRATRPAPAQGEHTTEILAELGRAETER